MPPSSTALSDLYDVSLASNDRSSQNTMKRCGSGRRSAISSGSVSMSSRWISTSFNGREAGLSARALLISACTALTSDDLPMPRAPQRRALLAGRPRAKRSVLSASVSRTRSMPRSEEHTSELQSRKYLVCRLLLEKTKPRLNSPPPPLLTQHRHIGQATLKIVYLSAQSEASNQRKQTRHLLLALHFANLHD